MGLGCFFYFFEDLKDSGYTRIQVFYDKVEGQLFLAVGLPAVRRCSRAFSARKRTLYLFTLLVLRFEYTSKRLNCIDLNIKSSHSVWIMGNKHKLTGKERRAAVREEKKRALASRALVAKAKEKRDPLDELSIPLKMSLVGFDAVVTSSHWCTLDKETQEWILKLEEINVREMYEKSDWGWNGKVKQEEMTDEDARYLIARSAEGKPLGFSHFRFDMDFEDEVLYCYELQIEEHARRKGLGGFMLRVLEELTTHYNMKKTMLTVFKHNHPGRTFFKKNGYKLDETSPEDDDEEEEACYEILSKYNLKFDPPIV